MLRASFTTLTGHPDPATASPQAAYGHQLITAFEQRLTSHWPSHDTQHRLGAIFADFAGVVAALEAGVVTLSARFPESEEDSSGEEQLGPPGEAVPGGGTGGGGGGSLKHAVLAPLDGRAGAGYGRADPAPPAQTGAALDKLAAGLRSGFDTLRTRFTQLTEDSPAAMPGQADIGRRVISEFDAVSQGPLSPKTTVRLGALYMQLQEVVDSLQPPPDGYSPPQPPPRTKISRCLRRPAAG
jgi:hypothetical protein